MKPVIGLNCDVEDADGGGQRLRVLRNYADAVELAGGVPVVLPPTENVKHIEAQLDLADGLMLIGGLDYDPRLYGAKRHPETRLLHAVRQTYDCELARAVLHRKMPLLAICGGLQLVNIVCGGDLVQHVPDVVPKEPHDGHDHEVVVEAGTRLAGIVGEGRLRVNSTHHQAAGRVGSGLRVAARSDGGVIEALESGKDPFLICVQWHPERLTGEAKQLALFKALVDASAKHRQ